MLTILYIRRHYLGIIRIYFFLYFLLLIVFHI